MKKIIVLFVLAVVLNSCASLKKTPKVARIKFQKQKFEEVLAIAKEQDKLVFIDFWASWCGPCRRMDEEVLSNKEIVEYYNKNFINIKLDADSEDAIIPKINYDIRSIPAYVWVDGDGNMVYYYKGTTTISNFLSLGKNALINGGKITF